jgi:hypothetical protein
MSPTPNTEIDVKTLLTLRQEHDAVQIITDRLRAKEMGPSDHIRTKHEVKAFVESGDLMVAEELVKNARERLAVKQTISEQISQRQGQRMGP